MTTQAMHTTLIMSYPVGESVPKSALAGKPVVALDSATATLAVSAAVANTWTQIAKISPGTLTPGKYAVSKVYMYGATSKAFRLTNPGFFNLKPGGPIGHTICHKKNLFDFGDFDECPVFDASTELGIELLATSTDTAVAFIELVKLS